MIRQVHSSAKINLFLYISGKRPDGYHDLFSLMTQINLDDLIRIDFSSESICVECAYPGVPEDESNIAYKAARLFFDTMGSRQSGKKGVSIAIEKKIPPGGGLGGGSSNAAVVLAELNRYHNNPFSRSELMKIGLQLGADVPFFLFNSPAIATGVGEKLEAVEKLVPYHLVLCDPGVSASTGDVYKNIDFRLTSKPKSNINTGLNVPLRGQGFDVRGRMHNDLFEPACRLYPEIRKTKEEMGLLLEREVFMTGSGSSLFALFSNRKNAARGAEVLSERWQGSRRKLFLSSFKI